MSSQNTARSSSQQQGQRFGANRSSGSGGGGGGGIMSSQNTGRSSSPQLAATPPTVGTPSGGGGGGIGTPVSPRSLSEGLGMPGFRRHDLSGSMAERRPGRRRRMQYRQQHGSAPSTPGTHRTPSSTPAQGTPGRSPWTPQQEPQQQQQQEAGQQQGFEGAAAAATGAFEENSDAPETFVWGTSVSVQDVTRKFTAFVRGFRESDDDMEAKYLKLLKDVVEREEDTFNIDCRDVLKFNPQLYNLLVKYPLEVVPIFDLVVADLAAELTPDWTRHIQVRTFNLKDVVHMRDLNPEDVDQLVAVKGMVIRCSPIIPDIKAGFFKCSICGHCPDYVYVDRGRIEEPLRCERPDCAARNSMVLVHNRCKFINKQLVRLQETPESIPEGETPHTVTVCMFDSLVDFAKPGDRVEITGVFRAVPVRVNPAHRSLRSLYKTYLDCIHVRKEEKGRLSSGTEEATGDASAGQPISGQVPSTPRPDPAEGFYFPPSQVEKLKALSQQPDIYERLTRSLAPSILGLDDVKKGLLCQLFGGSMKQLPTGAKFRGDVNVLLVGDPGTSKSQLLQYVHKIAPRGIYTSGRGSSAVGLTAYLTKDPETGEMVLESGALVLSDRGICCIDEFDKMSENARSMLHEVMEQQTVSVAKAGIIATLNARTSVMACANPRESRYNPRLSVIDNIQLPPTLLSRFDLIYLLLDKADETSDRRLARHLVSLFYNGASAQQEQQREMTLDANTLAAYISYARNNVQPQLSDAASEDLVNTYVELRSRGVGRKVITATLRQLESLIRISEALARMRFGDTVETWDVAEARRLLEVAMQQSATDPVTGTIDMDLITTGVSASERTKQTQIAEAVMGIVRERITASRPSMPAMQIWEELKQQTSIPVSFNEVRDALSRLHGEGKLVFADNIVRAERGDAF